MIDLSVKVIENLIHDMKAETQRVQKATSDGLKVAGFKHMRSMQTALKQGHLNLEPLHPYRNPYHDKRYKRPSRRMEEPSKPMKTLAPGIKYFAPRGSRYFEFGFLEGSRTRTPRLTALAEKMVPGFRIMISDDTKKYLHKIGIHMRKATAASNVPARDPVGNYYRMNRIGMEKDIADYIDAKLRGDRI